MTRRESLTELNRVLTRRRDALRLALTGDTSLLNEISSDGQGDVIDWAIDTVNSELSSRLAEFESRELENVENALQRMDEGVYGICEGCDCSIPMARLQALPYATMCINCQRLVEKGEFEGRRNADWSRIVDMGTEETRTRELDIKAY